MTTDSGTDMDYPETIEEEYYISALPEGFEITNAVRTDNSIDISHFRGEEYILFSQYAKSKYKQNYDNERTVSQEFTDEDGQKYLVFVNDNNFTYIWDNGRYILEITSNLNKDELLKLCKSTKVKK